jgi:energy-coupling factor transporter ATP-binding protein EcfA2
VRGIRLSDRVFMVGQTGMGKTTLALWLLDGLQPVRTIVFDPKEEWADGQLGAPACRTPGELPHVVGRPVTHYIPASFDRDKLEEACQLIWKTPGPYVWLVDESSELTSANYVPAGLRLACTQGRRKRKMVIALTQRVAESNPVLRAGADHTFIFVPTPIELDLKAIAASIHREPALLQEELESLQAEHGLYSHLWFVRETNELRRCAPLAAGGHRGAPQPAAAPDEEPREPAGAPEEAEAESPS